MRRRAWWFLWLMPLIVAAGPVYVYWLEHPPVTPAEQELQAVARQASEIRIVRDDCGGDDCPVLARINGVKIQKLLDIMRVSNSYVGFNMAVVDMRSVRFVFYSQQKLLTRIHYLPRFKDGAYLQSDGRRDVLWASHGYYLRPHFVERLDAFISAQSKHP